jgi:hypothetical protein
VDALVNSRNKGKRGELEFVSKLAQHGWNGRRSQQFCGANGDADVVSDDLQFLHFEVKRRNAGNVHHWMDQARNDARWQIPTVCHRRDHSEWLMTFRADDVLGAIAPFLEPEKLTEFLKLQRLIVDGTP